MVKVVWAQYGVLGVQFWLLPFPGPERYRSPLYASGGTDEPIVLVCTAVCFWFSRSALWHNSSNIGYIEWLFIYICLFLIKIWNFIYGIRYLSLIDYDLRAFSLGCKHPNIHKKYLTFFDP